MSEPASTAPLAAPDLCPRCLALSIIATRTGPTCSHRTPNGAAWFPPWWTDRATDPASAPRRAEYLQLLPP